MKIQSKVPRFHSINVRINTFGCPRLYMIHKINLTFVPLSYTKCQSCCKCCVGWRCLTIGDQEAQIGNTDLVICYLCNKKVLRSEWEKEETDHRSYCAVKSKENRGENIKKK